MVLERGLTIFLRIAKTLELQAAIAQRRIAFAPGCLRSQRHFEVRNPGSTSSSRQIETSDVS